MPILKDLTKKLKKFTQAATAKFKEPKSTELESALQKIIVEINNFNLIKVVDEENTKKFTEKIKSIFKSTCLRKYYKPGENDKVTYKRSGLTGIIFRELYIYLTKDFRQGVNTAYAPAAGWLSIKDKNTLKKSFQSTYIAKFRSDEAWVESILYNEQVLTKLFHIAQRVQIGQASTPPKGQAPQPPKAEASKTPQSPIKLPSAPPISKVNHDVLLNSISNIFLSSRFDPKLTSDEQNEFDALKKYFKDNAVTITNKIIDIKDDKNRKNWIQYFTKMPFSQKMVFENFENSLYGEKDGLFNAMRKDGIRPNAPIPKNLPKGVKLPAQKQPSKPLAPPAEPAPQPPKTATSSSQPPQKPKPPMPQPPVPQPNIAEQKKIYNDLKAQRDQFREQNNFILYNAAKEACTAQAQYISSISANKSDSILKEEAKTATEKINAFELEKERASVQTQAKPAKRPLPKPNPNSTARPPASEPPKKPQPSIPQQPTGQDNAKLTAEQLKNASGSLKKVANPMTSKRKSVVEQVFENTTNSPMFKRAQQQNQTQDEDDDDAWTD
ncbi:MAG: hypothetical protein IJI84_04250 [Clostridia bacterium]|nr:hypothetical protein [Clostridia bacterium]